MEERMIPEFDEKSLAAALQARIVHPCGHRFTSVLTDSRQIHGGELFVALSGERFDAHDFVGDVARAGAHGAVVSRELDVPQDFTLFVVEDVQKAFGRLARAVLEKRRIQGGFVTYAVTGSNGKTTTKEMIAALLAEKGHRVLKTQGNHNNFVGLPITVMELCADHDVAVLEMGTNAPGEIEYLCSIGHPDRAVITGVGMAHLEGFGSVEGVAAAKGEMIFSKGLKEIVLPAETRKYYEGKIPCGVSVVWVGEDAQIGVLSVKSSLDGTDFILHDGIQNYSVHLPLPGAHNAENFARAYALLRSEGFSQEELNHAAAQIRLPSGRLERWIGRDDTMFLHDAYNANPSSMIQALRLIGSMTEASNRCMILGMMGELGPESDRYHREIGLEAGKLGAARILCVGNHAQNIREGAIAGGMEAADVFWVSPDDLNKGLDWLASALGSGMVCLIKGSRSVKLERVLDFFGAHRFEK